MQAKTAVQTGLRKMAPRDRAMNGIDFDGVDVRVGIPRGETASRVAERRAEFENAVRPELSAEHGKPRAVLEAISAAAVLAPMRTACGQQIRKWGVWPRRAARFPLVPFEKAPIGKGRRANSRRARF